jgi:ABC-type transport system substrate-binding protein
VSTDELTRLGLLKAGGGVASAFVLLNPGAAAAETLLHRSARARTTLTVAQPAEPASLDPTTRDLSESRTVYINLFDPLIHREPVNGKFVPVVLQSWRRVSPNHWRFGVRKNIRFQDGSLLKVSDVIYSINRYRDPKIYNASSRFATWKAVRQVSPNAFDVFTTLPDNLLIANIADLVFVVSEAYFTSHDAAHLATNPMGSGPYTLGSWTKGDRLVLNANPKYWQGAPPIKTVTFRPIPDDNTRSDAILRGDVDIATQLVPQQLSRLRGQSSLKVTSTELSAPVWIGIRLTNATPAAFKDVRVRQAFNYAVDKNAIIRRLLQAQGTAMGTPVPKVAFGYNPAVKPFPYDPNKAKTLLRQAGVSDLSIGMDLPASGLGGIHDPALAVAQYLGEVGVNVTPRVSELNAFVSRIVSDNLSDLFVQIYRDATLDAGAIYAAQILSTASTNHSHYANRTVDVLINNGLKARTEQGRMRSYNKLAELIHNEAPWIYLYSAKQITATKNYVTFAPRADLLVPAREVKLK